MFQTLQDADREAHQLVIRYFRERSPLPDTK